MNVIPGKLNLTLGPGVDFSATLTLEDAAGDPLPLNGYAPFASEIRSGVGGTLIATLTVDSTDAATGVLVLTLDGSATVGLSDRAFYDVIDAAGRKWIEGTVHFDPSITEFP